MEKEMIALFRKRIHKEGEMMSKENNGETVDQSNPVSMKKNQK
jgi:hypothetical protein